MAEDLVLVRLRALVEVVVKGLGVGELLFPALPTSTTAHMVNGKPFILRDPASRALTFSAVLCQHTLTDAPGPLSGLSPDALTVIFPVLSRTGSCLG